LTFALNHEYNRASYYRINTQAGWLNNRLHYFRPANSTFSDFTGRFPSIKHWLGRFSMSDKDDIPMTAESIFHAAFWVLFAGLLIMRIYFALRVRRAGERMMPDREAVERLVAKGAAQNARYEETGVRL